MKLIYLIISAVLIGFFSCNDSDNISIDSPKAEVSSDVKSNRQLNISVLWDLSDRINPEAHTMFPSNAERDVAIIKNFATYFRADMDKRGAFLSKGKLKVFFSPNPEDESIAKLAMKLDIDLSNMDIKSKKNVYDNIEKDFEQAAKEITDITIKTSNWTGSDIFRFFKNYINNCISTDTSYRNILVILTDGYIYDPQSNQKIGNKSEFMLGSLFSSLGMRDNPKFKEVYEKKKCGLIVPSNDLGNLEILVLEINSEENHKDDEDIIRYYLENWFSEMKAKRFEIHNTDLPGNTQKFITNFLNSK